MTQPSDPTTQLTIVLLLKNRTRYTWRWMRYANEVRLPYRVLIADGGNDPRVVEVLSQADSFPNVNYEYVRYSYDRRYADYFRKVADALARVATPFVVLACNDDFFITDGLERSARFLEAHPDYVAAAGDVWDFSVVPAGRHDPHNRVYGKAAAAETAYPARTFADETALGRLDNFIFHHVNSFPWMSVQRTQQWARSWRMLADVSPGGVRLADHLLLLLTVIGGKIRRMPGAYLLHQVNPQTSAGKDVAEQFPTWLHWIQRDGWFGDFSNCVEAISREIARVDGIPPQEAARHFLRSYFSLIGERTVEALYPAANVRVPIAVEQPAEAVRQTPEFVFVADFLRRGPAEFERQLHQQLDREIVFGAAVRRMIRRIWNKAA